MKQALLALVLLVGFAAEAGRPSPGELTGIPEGEPIPVPANVFEIPKGARRMVSVAGEIVRAESVCPPKVTCVRGGTLLTIQYTATGCFDKLAGVTATTVGDNLVIHAQMGANPKSIAALCKRFETFDIVTDTSLVPPFKVWFMGASDVPVVVDRYN